jgi:hypothetical protein
MEKKKKRWKTCELSINSMVQLCLTSAFVGSAKKKYLGYFFQHQEIFEV